MGIETYVVLISISAIILVAVIPSAVALDVTVRISNGASVQGCEKNEMCYVPSVTIIKVGDKVTWQNNDDIKHTVTSGITSYYGLTKPEGGPDGNFDSLLEKNESFSVIFDSFSPGKYPYYCKFHPWMSGLVILEEAMWWRKTIGLSVSTDSSSYEIGDLIRISGEVKEILSGVLITLQIINPDGELVVLHHLKVDFDKKFGTVIRTDDSWKSSGTYTVKVVYATKSRTVETSFDLDKASPDASLIMPLSTDVIIQPNTSVKGCEETDECYLPAKFRINPGESVTWFNADSAAHSVTSGMPDRYAGRLFDRTMFNAGGTFTFIFERVGDYSYHCSLHPWMRGVIIVDDSETNLVFDNNEKLETQIPEWVKNNAGWWAVGKILENEFIEAIQYLIEQRIITIEEISESTNVESKGIPEWVKNTAEWWANDQISDSEFLKAIQFLIEGRIIKVN